MGRVDFGAKVIEVEGKEYQVPEIYISAGEGKEVRQIVFTSNVLLDTVEEAEGFINAVFHILKGPKDPSKVNYYPGGNHGSGHLN